MSPDSSGFYWATRISMIGFEMVVPALAGWWADERFGTMPWITVSGACVGFLVAMLSLRDLARGGSKSDRTSQSKSNANNTKSNS